MTISDRIFDLLEEQNKKQTDLARAVGVRAATVTDWKQRRTSPSSDVLAAIGEFLGVSVDYLCTGKESAATAAAIKQGIFGDRNQNNTVTIHGNGTVEISEFDGELIKVCGRLDMRRKNALLTYAYDLEKQMLENK